MKYHLEKKTRDASSMPDFPHLKETELRDLTIVVYPNR